MKILLLFFGIIYSPILLSQGTSCGSPVSLGTPTATSSCTTMSSATSGSSPCAGQGYGGNSNGVTFLNFCTNAANDCIQFDISNGTASGNWSYTIYTSGCTGVMDAGCVGDISAGGGAITTSDAGLAANTCYTIRVVHANTGTFTICDQTNPTINDDCANATSVDSTPDSDDNFCTTPGPTTNAPTITPADLCAGSLENTAWYTFTVLNTNDVTVVFDNIVCTGGGAGFQIGYFTGTCGSLSNLGCSSGSGGTVTTTITGLTAGDVVTFAMDGNAGANCTYDISATNTVLLPIELTYFRVTQESKLKNVLHWATASELNNDKFIIETSNDLTAWNNLREINGSGTSNTSTSYEFTDYSPTGTISYYRLKQIDFDGKLLHSKIVSVLNFSLPETKEIIAKFDFLGRQVSEYYTGFVIVLYDNGSKEKLYINNGLK
jgi:hypothetical protein